MLADALHFAFALQIAFADWERTRPKEAPVSEPTIMSGAKHKGQCTLSKRGEPTIISVLQGEI